MRLINRTIRMNLWGCQRCILRFINFNDQTHNKSSRFYSAEVKNAKAVPSTKTSARFEAADNFELDGLRIRTDPELWNISGNVVNLLHRRLLMEQGNPLNLLKRRIINHFNHEHRYSIDLLLSYMFN